MKPHFVMATNHVTLEVTKRIYNAGNPYICFQSKTIMVAIL